MIDSVDLVHMNGRVYDPEIGRFLSADPHVQDATNLQSWNRYTYVNNNPLSFTDPSGFFLSGLFKSIGNFFSSLFRGIGNVLKQALKNGILRSILTIIGCAATAVGGPVGWAACGAISGAITIAGGGSIADGLKAFAFAFISAGVWHSVGFALDGVRAALGDAFSLVKAGIHGIVLGALSVAQGGSFLQGFASNAIGALGGAVADGITSDVVANTLIVAAAGCAGAAVTGGKCAEGALTAAFANLFNKFRLGSGPDARTYINPWDVGNDAHRTLQTKLAEVAGYDYERWSGPDGAWFGGRVDVLDASRPVSSIWEIKPDSPAGIQQGFMQVTGYLIVANLTGSGYTYGTAFAGTSGMTLTGSFGTYSYRLAAPGVIAYEMTAVNQGVFAFGFATYFALRASTIPSQYPGLRLPMPGGRVRVR
jgi:RHS repeat-associated protein